MRIERKLAIAIALYGLSLLFTSQTWAVPNLQIYIPGATYDTDSETWVIYSYDYQLWVIGAERDVADVKIALAVPKDESGSIELAWLDTTNLDPDPVPPGEQAATLAPGWSDYGDPAAQYLILTQEDALDIDQYRDSYGFGGDPATPDPATYGHAENDTPLMGDESQVPPHGVFPTDFYEYFIGGFNTNETVYNYIPGDEEEDTASGQIKAFDISVSGYTWVDIVAYNHVILGNNKAKYVFSPFSHDGGSTPIPEPATMLLVSLGLLGLVYFKRRFSRL